MLKRQRNNLKEFPKTKAYSIKAKNNDGIEL